jgi:hypothetical protein
VRYLESKPLFETHGAFNRQDFRESKGAYWTVTLTTVEIVVAPDVPVTVMAARPAGVPGDTGALEL